MYLMFLSSISTLTFASLQIRCDIMYDDEFPGMFVDNGWIIIDVSDADRARHPTTVPNVQSIVDDEDGVYYTVADARTRKRWLWKLGWLVIRSGPGIQNGTSVFRPFFAFCSPFVRRQPPVYARRLSRWVRVVR